MGVSHTEFPHQWPISFEAYSEVWLVGGDGTLNYFINHYPQETKALTIFKGGTGNDFHWMLYGGMQMEQQVDQVLSGTITKVDAGKCNDKLFINILGIGFDAKVSKDLTGKQKRPGKTSYMMAVLRNIFFFDSFQCHITCSEFLGNYNCLMVSVSNGKRTGGGFYVTPKALVNDGFLDVSIVRNVHSIQRMKYLPLIEKGKHLDLPFVKYQQTDSVVIEAAKEIHAHVDGEYFAAREFNVTCLPARFSFLV